MSYELLETARSPQSVEVWAWRCDPVDGNHM